MNKTRTRSIAVITSCGLLGLLAGVWAAQSGKTLVLNGRVASNDVRIINGKAYVPLEDIAKANDMVVVMTQRGYEIKKAGGATPIKGLQGKVGDVLFDGKWRFQVLSVENVGTYHMKYKATSDYAIYHNVASLDDKTFSPAEGRKLIAIKCRLTNGRNAMAALWIVNSDTRTAIADMNGESYPPIAYDLDESGPFQSKSLVPGAKTDFTVLFSIPDGTALKDLIFTLRTINGTDKGNDARVSLRN